MPCDTFFGAEQAQVSRQRSRSREQHWMDSGRVLRSDQSDCSLPRGRAIFHWRAGEFFFGRS